MKVILSVLLVCLIGAVYCAEEECTPPPDCGTPLGPQCSPPNCAGIQEGGPWVLRQNPCHCCPGCYVEKKAGEECGKDSSTLCVEGLKCVNNKCTA
ncbi:hypothetical protein JTB14_021777 [Gonioctena quinquepunctata]|nr:hypothetical protein JTB14_021777 [Gonioctena quinquepunctata]